MCSLVGQSSQKIQFSVLHKLSNLAEWCGCLCSQVQKLNIQKSEDKQHLLSCLLFSLQKLLSSRWRAIGVNKSKKMLKWKCILICICPDQLRKMADKLVSSERHMPQRLATTARGSLIDCLSDVVLRCGHGRWPTGLTEMAACLIVGYFQLCRYSALLF